MMLEWLKNRLVDDWRDSWRWWSVRFGSAGWTILALVEALRQAWIYVPPSLYPYLPFGRYLAGAFFAAGLISRFLKQPEKRHGG